MKGSFEGSNSFIEYLYDAFGLLLGSTTPAQAPLTGAWNYYIHDHAGRLSSVTDGKNASTVYRYEGLKTIQISPEGRETQEIRNPDGDVITKVDVMIDEVTTARTELKTHYKYGAYRQLERITDAAGNVTQIGYDAAGRRTSLADPDAGAWTYKVNAFGEVVSATDPLQQLAKYARDGLGRVKTVTNVDGITDFTWDTRAYGLGKLAETRSPDNAIVRSFYDSLSRPSRKEVVVEGITYTGQMQYDALGRLLQLDYPTAPGMTQRFGVRYTYQNGYLDNVIDVRNERWLWNAMAMDPAGRVRQYSAGNGLYLRREFEKETMLLTRQVLGPASGPQVQTIDYSYDLDRNLRHRDELEVARDETFGYNSLGQLNWWSVATSGNITTQVKYRYDNIGNLLAALCDNGTWGDVIYDFGAGTAGPHAVTKRNSTVYNYDLRGRMISGDGTSLWYTDFDLPHTITKAGVSTSIDYDASGHRVLKRDAAGSTVYFDNLYEKRVTQATGSPPSAIDHVFHVWADGEIVAQVTRREGASVDQNFYIHSDLIGSVGLVTNDSAAVVQRWYYEPFGSRAAANGNPATVPPGVVRKAFGGHEEEFGLLNMGGRFYSPSLRRFLTTDPFVSDLAYGGLNRYAYALNNPWKYVDPTGFQAIEGQCVDSCAMPDDHIQAGGNGTKDPPEPQPQKPARQQAPSVMVGRNVGDSSSGEAYSPADTKGASSGGSSAGGGFLTPTSGWGVAARVGIDIAIGSIPVVGSLYDTYNDLSTLFDSSSTTLDKTLSVVGIGMNLVTGALPGGGAIRAAAKTGLKALVIKMGKASVKAAPGGLCFTGDTPIATPAGPVPIANVRVGNRVLTYGELKSAATAVDPETWRLVRLEMLNPDGSEDILEIELLRPLTWLAEHDVHAGTTIDFVLPEMGLEGPALVVALEPCPPLQAGAGRVVLSTVTHLNAEVLQLAFEATSEVLEPTATHRLFSADRNAWVPAGELAPGERLITAGGTARIASISPKPGVHRVYNLEVETEHSFLASELGVLSHNENPCAKAIKGGGETLSRLGTSRESAGRLGRKAAEAEEHLGIHGVSVSAGTPNGPASQAAREAVEAGFPVHNTPTRNDPLHRTVELPNPVTQEVADSFNRVFGRIQ